VRSVIFKSFVGEFRYIFCRNFTADNSFSGRTQEEIARVVGRRQSTVSEILSEIQNLENATKSLLARGDSVEDVAGKLGLHKEGD